MKHDKTRCLVQALAIAAVALVLARFGRIDVCFSNAGMTGATYMWSIFATPLIQTHGWTASEVSLAHSLYFIMQFVMGFVSGVLQPRLGTRPLAMAGGALFNPLVRYLRQSLQKSAKDAKIGKGCKRKRDQCRN